MLCLALVTCKKNETSNTPEIPNTTPKLTTSAPIKITSFSASVEGVLLSNGGSAVTNCGVCWSLSQNPTIDDNVTTAVIGSGSFTINIIPLIPGLTYYVRAYATNSIGTAYGNQISFTTLAVPKITSSLVSFTATTANCQVNISSDGGSPIIAKGVCWGIAISPTINDSKTLDGTGADGFISLIKDLTSAKRYYARAYATNSAGTGYSDILSFTTSLASPTFNPYQTYGTMVDIDGNVYKTIKIGAQTWMAENLRVTHEKNGANIPNIADNTLWSTANSGAYCAFNNDPNYSKVYGAIYNGYAVLQLSLAPTGWHIPKDSEWTTLIDYLGGTNSSISKLCESGMVHWDGLKSSFSNESGFTLIPAGGRESNGIFSVNISVGATLWGRVTTGNVDFWYQIFAEDHTEYIRNDYYKAGVGIRCIKDN